MILNGQIETHIDYQEHEKHAIIKWSVLSVTCVCQQYPTQEPSGDYYSWCDDLDYPKGSASFPRD